MAILESLLVALGTGIAKYLAKELLPQDLQDQIAGELISLGARQLTARQSADPVEAEIGGRVKTLYDRSSPGRKRQERCADRGDLHAGGGADQCQAPGRA